MKLAAAKTDLQTWYQFAETMSAHEKNFQVQCSNTEQELHALSEYIDIIQLENVIERVRFWFTDTRSISKGKYTCTYKSGQRGPESF